MQAMNTLIATPTVEAVGVTGGRLVICQPDHAEEDFETVAKGIGVWDYDGDDEDYFFPASGQMIWWIPNA